MASNRTPRFFATPAEFRHWLRLHHDSETQLLVGFYKKGSGKKSITWPESVDQALCYGWIDGIRRSLDDERYVIRFTPRKTASHWSNVNIERVKVLRAGRLMRAAGEQAFARRRASRSGRAAYEQKSVAPSPELRRRIKADPGAWDFFSSQPPSYRKQCIWWVVGAKKEETRDRRISILIASSARREWIPPMKWTAKRTRKRPSRE